MLAACGTQLVAAYSDPRVYSRLLWEDANLPLVARPRPFVIPKEAVAPWVMIAPPICRGNSAPPTVVYPKKRVPAADPSLFWEDRSLLVL